MSKARVSVRGAVRDAKRADTRARSAIATGSVDGAGMPQGVRSLDSFVNFAHKLGIGSDNVLTSGTYGFNPITRNRQLLEWIHRGSWLGGQAVDVVADDMTRAGVEFLTELDPDDQQRLEERANTLGVWDKLNEAIKWGRLYGGSIAVLLIDGQDLKTPLRLETVGPGQFKGLAVFDRWQLEPSLEDLVTEYGPHLGKPRYYKVQANAPALRGATIHYSRLVGRFVGIELPYQQAMTENLWGISVLERLYDRMVAFDSASLGAAQLVFKSHLRTLKVKDLRDIIAAGGKLLDGVVAQVNLMRRFQGIEGVTLLDANDEFDVQSTSSFTGADQVITQLAMQICGALRIPMTRLFGQSPGGLSTDDKSGLRTYYEGIQQDQTRDLGDGIHLAYKCMAASEQIKVPDTFLLKFASLETLSDDDRAEIAGKTIKAVGEAYDNGLISQQAAMKELRQSSRTTGIFNNISDADIKAADDQITPPMDELMDLGLGGEGEDDGDSTPTPEQPAQSVGRRAPRRALLPD